MDKEVEEKPIEKEKIDIEKINESLKDYASRRLTELKNYEQQLVDKMSQLQAALNQTNTELISCRAVIGEMTRVIEDKVLPPPKNP